MIDILSSVEFWKFALPLFGAVIAWFLNEWRKRLWEQYQRKEASYKELVRCIRGFYIGAENACHLKGEFLINLISVGYIVLTKSLRKDMHFLTLFIPIKSTLIISKKKQWANL